MNDRRFGSGAPTLARLRSLSDEDLIQAHDERARHLSAGVDYYLAELRARETERMTRRMLHLTWLIVGFTLVVTVATVINVVLLARAG